MKNIRWEISPLQDKIEYDSVVISRLADMVLATRGIYGQSDVSLFLRSDLGMLHDPFLLPDMEKAVLQVNNAIENQLSIAVYGDYDVDGVTSTCILVKYLRGRGAKCQYYIPDRISEGYGLNMQAIKALKDRGVDLLITVDSGITAVSEVEYAKSLGMKVVITDHHECKEIVPNADAVVNPRRLDSTYPFKELAGVGVAFKLLCALEQGKKTTEEMVDLYGDIVAIGTIADVMPLVLENRAIVSRGLKLLEKTQNLGTLALMRKLNIYGKQISSTNISFMVAPRINAAGRLGEAVNSAKLLLTEDEDEAYELSELLCDLNSQRQGAENEIYKEIAKKIAVEFDPKQDRAIVMWGESWHNGVIGIVASRLAEKYYVPTILISLEGDKGKGSGRSIKGVNLYQALEKNCQSLEKYGGHEMAVGLTIDKSKLEEFRQDFYKYCKDMPACDNTPSILVDCEVSGEDLTLSEVQSLSILEPFGMGNAQPIFLLKNMTIVEITPIGKDKHIKFKLCQRDMEFSALAFGLSSMACPYVCGDMVDIVCTADINDFRGVKSVQLIVKDLALCSSEKLVDEGEYDSYLSFLRGDTLERDKALKICPDRDDLVSVFRHLKLKLHEENVDIRSIYRKIRYEAKNDMSLAKLMICIDILQEFAIATVERQGFLAKIVINDIGAKVDINQSLILKRLRQG